jgi:hypothetical protein
MSSNPLSPAALVAGLVVGAVVLVSLVSAGLDSPELPQAAAKMVQDRAKISLLFIFSIFGQ